MKTYFHRRHELSADNGCLLLGYRVVIPALLRDKIMEELHSCHPGMSRMKALGRNYVWWPTMNKEIEQLVSSCATCAGLRNQGPVTPLHPWKWPTRVYERVHIHYAGMEG